MGFDITDLGDKIAGGAYLGPFGAFGVGGELRLLPDLLLKDERILALTRGRVDSTMWVMAVTDSRVLLVNKGLLFGHRHLEVPLDRVKSSSYRIGLLSGAIFIDTGGGTVVLEGVNKKGVVEVSAVISQAIHARLREEARGAPSGAPQGAAADTAAALERLAALRDKGTLTEAEFHSQKRRLLGKRGDLRVVDPARPARRDEPGAGDPRAPGG
jgi:hypothetical protein